MKEVNPKETSRSMAFDLWMSAPMPMVTFFKKLDVTHLYRYANKNKLKFNMMMCYAIGLAASRVPEFQLLPVNNKLIQYDQLAINTIVMNINGSINSCDIPFDKNIKQFNNEYLRLTKHVAETCTNYDAENCMVIGTSALVQDELDGVVGMYSGIYNNPYLIWSKYKSFFFRKKLNISFQFHHVQMDGAHASHFLSELQGIINNVSF